MNSIKTTNWMLIGIVLLIVGSVVHFNSKCSADATTEEATDKK